MRLERIAVTFALLGALGCAAKKPPVAGPAAPGVPEWVQAYVGQGLILRGQGSESKLSFARKDLGRAGGGCDVAVEVKQATLDKGVLRLGLITLGRVALEKKGASGCNSKQSGMQVAISGFAADAPAEAAQADVAKLLATPEAYLAASGVAFDRPAGPDPKQVASNEKDASMEERALARQVTSWPKPLLRVDPAYNDLSGRVRQETEVEVVAVVGDDGRPRRVVVRTPLSQSHEEQVRRAFALWRFEPAQRKEGALAARVTLRGSFRIY